MDAVPGQEPEQEVLEGFPIPRLVDEPPGPARSDRRSGPGRLAGLLVGSVAFALAAQGGCPVVVVRGRADATGGPVVVGIDGSPVSEAALAFAYEAAALRSAPLLAGRVARTVHRPGDVPSLDWDSVEQEAQAELAERLAGWREKYPDADAQRLVVRDRPALVPAEQSAGAQLVVVGSHGRGGAAGLVLGSVSHAVLYRADCPAVIVRTDVRSGSSMSVAMGHGRPGVGGGRPGGARPGNDAIRCAGPTRCRGTPRRPARSSPV